MSNVIDLDTLVPVDKKVVFGQRTWEVPGDMPMELFVQLQMLTEQADEEDDSRSSREIFDEMIGIMMKLFTYKVPESDEEPRAFLDGKFRQLGVKTFMQLWRHIYGEEADKEPDPTEPTASPEQEDGATTSSPQMPEPTPSPESPEPTTEQPAESAS